MQARLFFPQNLTFRSVIFKLNACLKSLFLRNREVWACMQNFKKVLRTLKNVNLWI